MTQKNGVLTREDNPISCICPGRTATQEDCLTVPERVPPLNTTEQTWIFEVREKARAGRRAPKPGSLLVDIIRWLYYLGSGKVDDRLLEARHEIHQNIRIDGMRL